MGKEISMDIQENFDFIIEESGNSSTNLRKISWNGRPHKLDIRKWAIQDDGTERSLRGITLTDDGGHELTNVLVEQGYGDTKRIIKALINRDEYEDVMQHLDDDDEYIDDSEEMYYDPSELLLLSPAYGEE